MSKSIDANARKDAEIKELFALKSGEELRKSADETVHRFGRGGHIICRTDSRPRPKSPTRIVVDATEGFVPLWERNRVLRWKFDTASLAVFQHPEDIKTRVRATFERSVAAWGDAAPIRFVESADNADFRMVMHRKEDCDATGCTLASAFFPDSGRHKLNIYPTMFTQSAAEQDETLEHEIGHIFGLRHYFATTDEQQWPSEIFGKHSKFSIMNYGADSKLTASDRKDLKRLYQAAWNGDIHDVKGTPIHFVRPFHDSHA